MFYPGGGCPGEYFPGDTILLPAPAGISSSGGTIVHLTERFPLHRHLAKGASVAQIIVTATSEGRRQAFGSPSIAQSVLTLAAGGVKRGAGGRSAGLDINGFGVGAALDLELVLALYCAQQVTRRS